MKLRNLKRASLLATTVLIWSGTHGVYAEDLPERGGTLTVAIDQMGPTADPVVTTFGTNWRTAAVACEGLFGRDLNWTPQPVLAESYSYNDAGTELTVKLREGIKFHSGADMTSADVVASLERFMSAAGIGGALKAAVSSLTAMDDHTIKFTLAKPSPIIPALLTVPQGAIMSKASIADASGTEPTKELDCTGPYTLESYRPDQGATLKRFDGYQSLETPASAESGAKHAFADTIELVLQPEASVRRDSLITGQVDVAVSLPVDFYEALEAEPSTDPVIVKNNMSLTIVFNTKEGVAADPDLRAAIYYALDKEPIMRASVGNPEFYTLDPSWVPDPGSIWHSTAGVDGDFAKGNMDKAKEHLEKSGYDGEKIRWLVAKEQYTKHFLPAVTAQQQLADAGINVEIIEQPIATYLKDRADSTKMDAFSSFLPTYMDPVSIAYFNPSYPGWWTDPKKMELMEQIASTLDTEERVKLFNEVHALAYEQFPFIKYGTEASLAGERKGVWGLSRTPVTNWNYYNVAPPKQ